MQSLNELQPVPLRILSVNDSQLTIPVGSKLWLGDESNPAASQFPIGLPQIPHVKTNMAGTELMLVQIPLPGRGIDEVNQFDLMIAVKPDKHQLSVGPGNTGVVTLRRSQGVDATQDVQSKDLGVEPNHSLQVLDHDPGVVKSLNQPSHLFGAMTPCLTPLLSRKTLLRRT